MKADIVFRYFQNLTPQQTGQIERLNELYTYWNAQINVISRKDTDALYLRHVLHALGIAKLVEFKSGEHILDVGTGGGFPGIPLAILFPQARFTLVDSIGKKIKVVHEICGSLGLKNVQTVHGRAEHIPGQFNFIVSRAVTRLSTFYPWVQGKIRSESLNSVPNGILYLKGGDLEEEIRESRLQATLIPLSRYFSESFFETKYIVQIPM